MSVTLFVSIFVGGGLITMLLTQSIKQFYYNRGSEASPNLIALINAIVVGGGGTAFAYMLLHLPWTVNNVLCLIAMVWRKSIENGTNIVDATKKLYDETSDSEGEVK